MTVGIIVQINSSVTLDLLKTSLFFGAVFFKPCKTPLIKNPETTVKIPTMYTKISW